jgi:hypothetical protein
VLDFLPVVRELSARLTNVRRVDTSQRISVSPHAAPGAIRLSGMFRSPVQR